jgi:hypothetical protein
MTIGQRQVAVENLVHLRVPVDQAVSVLKSFPWDCEQELVTVGVTEVETALNRFIKGNLSTDELEAWANGIEGRDDIEFRPTLVIDVVTEIANPLLFSPLDKKTAGELLARLGSLPNS